MHCFFLFVGIKREKLLKKSNVKKGGVSINVGVKLSNRISNF